MVRVVSLLLDIYTFGEYLMLLDGIREEGDCAYGILRCVCGS